MGTSISYRLQKGLIGICNLASLLITPLRHIREVFLAVVFVGALGFATDAYAASITLGAFIYDPAKLGTSSAPWDPSVIDKFTTMVGGKIGAINWYEWITYGFTKANFDAVASRGMVPVLSWAPDLTDRRIANGERDSAIHSFARAAKTWGKPFYLRLAWEMNLPEIGVWAVGRSGNTAADYVAMWRHVYNIFKADGATNVRFFWCPNEVGSGPSFSSIYPGDAYVSVVGFDAYNWGNSQSWSKWRSLVDTYRPTYNALTTLTSKPIVIGETGSVEGGGNKAAWISSFLTDLPTKFPRIIGVLYFDENDTALKADWRVNTSSASLNAFKQVVASSLYKGRLP